MLKRLRNPLTFFIKKNYSLIILNTIYQVINYKVEFFLTQPNQNEFFLSNLD